ncbi:sialate O-acetylesterase [Sphingobacterium sp. DN00404]|uniref:Sialate O-acetylesterase n=1 Tax=Sphingobacterium micropteri TaxID=2763501 RepID=A0ABR7YUK6_9SPHI|nr:sialate O-acetylesterase [Sphingobacterium micropteri]MBD1435010.1 sialate O-acetylesterase [Sphingobacterium micropteri]
MKTIITVFLLCISLGLHAEVRLSTIFTDGMVLQQKKRVPIWGWAGKAATIKVETSWDQKEYQAKADEKGVWRLFIQTPEAGGPYSVTVSEKNTIVLDDVLIGEVWLCSGQSNMEMPLKGYPAQPIIGSTDAILGSKDEQLRLYTVPRNPLLKPADDSKPSLWKKANPQNVASFSATAYFFGRRLREVLDVPVGLIHSSYGGSNIEAWMDAAWLQDVEGVEIPQQEEGLKDKNRVPTMLYNGMIHPLVEYGIKGMIWYQGESNYETADRYEILFPRMVAKYRALWKDDMLPFYFTQIAPFDYASLPPYYVGGKYNSAFIRDAQRKSLTKIPESGMAVTMDIGEKNCIHPAHKKEGGDRLALLALGDAYHIEGLNHRSPVYDSIAIEGSTVVVYFKDAPLGLTSFGKDIKSFEIAGENKVFHLASAIVQGKTIVLSSPSVAKPVAVRYAFKDFVVGDLFGVNGLPVSSFRTDDW